MANEIKWVHTLTGVTDMYFVIRTPAGTRWSTAGTPNFETLTVANWANYKIAMSESPASSYQYQATFPAISGNMVAGWYHVDVYSGAVGPADVCLGGYFGYWDGTTFKYWGSDMLQVAGTSQTARDIGASVLLSVGTGTGQVNLSSGKVPATLAAADATGNLPAIVNGYAQDQSPLPWAVLTMIGTPGFVGIYDRIANPDEAGHPGYKIWQRRGQYAGNDYYIWGVGSTWFIGTTAWGQETGYEKVAEDALGTLEAVPTGVYFGSGDGVSVTCDTAPVDVVTMTGSSFSGWYTYFTSGITANVASLLGLLDIMEGITSLARWLRALARKDIADDAPAVTEINDGDVPGTYLPSTDSLEAIRDTAPLGTAMRGTDSALLAANYVAPANSDIADAKAASEAVDTLTKAGGNGDLAAMKTAQGTQSGYLVRVLRWLRIIGRKDAAPASQLTEFNAADDSWAATGTFTNGSESIEAVAGAVPSTSAISAAVAQALTGVVIVHSPVTEELDIEITRYDDYQGSRALPFSNSYGTWCGGDISGATVTFVAKSLAGTTVLTQAGAIVTATGTQAVTVSLTSAQTALFTAPGRLYTYQLLIAKTGDRETVVNGYVTVSDSLSPPSA